MIVYIFQNQGGPCNYWIWEEETKRQIFSLKSKGGHLWSFVLVRGRNMF